MQIPAHYDLEENIAPDYQPQATRQAVRHKHATVLNSGTCALLTLPATPAGPAGRRRSTARGSCFRSYTVQERPGNGDGRGAEKENERELLFFSLHQITSASKEHHHRFLLPQTGQTSRPASAAAARGPQSFFDPGAGDFSSLSIQELPAWPPGSGCRGPGEKTAGGGNAPPLQLRELAKKRAGAFSAARRRPAAPQISPPRALKRRLPAPSSSRSTADPPAAAGGERAATATSS